MYDLQSLHNVLEFACLVPDGSFQLAIIFDVYLSGFSPLILFLFLAVTFSLPS